MGINILARCKYINSSPGGGCIYRLQAKPEDPYIICPNDSGYNGKNNGHCILVETVHKTKDNEERE